MTEVTIGPGDHLSGGNRHTLLLPCGRIGEDKVPIAFQVHHTYVALRHLASVRTVTVMVVMLVRVTHMLREGQKHRVLGHREQSGPTRP